MAEHKTRLIAYSPRLDKFLRDGINGIGTTDLSQEDSSTGKRQSLIPSVYSVGSGNAEIGVLASGPSGGYGSAVWQPVKVNSDGTWTASGSTSAVIVPLLK